MKKRSMILGIIILIVLSGVLINGNGILLNIGYHIFGVQENAQGETYILVYFCDKNGIYLVPEVRTIELKDSGIVEKIMDELMKGPQSKELLSEIPDNTRLISVIEKDEIVYANFDKSFKNTMENAAEAKGMCIASIVNSLTEVPGIRSIQFLIEGEKWGKPFKRMRNVVKREDMNPSEVLKRQMTLEKQGDWLNSYLLMSDEESNNGRKYYDEYIKEIKEAREEGLLNAEFEVGDFSIDPENSNRASVKINFVIKNPDGSFFKSPDVFFNTIKVDGYWKVDWLVGQEKKDY